MASTEGKAAPKSARHKSGAKLLPEALAVDLHVVEDEDMIRSLGREKFVDLCINGKQGFQEGVSAFTYIPLLFMFIVLFYVFRNSHTELSIYSCSFANELLSTPEYVIVHSHYVLLLLLLLNFLVHTSTLSVTHRPTHIHSHVLHYAHLKTVLQFIIYLFFFVFFSSIGLSVLLLQHNHRYAIGISVVRM